MSITSAVVLAAGEGERLRPLTHHRPKPMLPAATRPILEYVLDAIVNAGIEDLHIVVGYEHGRVQSHFGHSYRDCPITYHVQRKQVGSGHALLQARDAVDSDFLVVNGDEVFGDSLVKETIAAHSADAVCTLAIAESELAANYGAVTLKGDRVVKLVEHPDEQSHRLLNAGIYAFGPSIFSEIESTSRTDGELSLPDAIAQIVDRGGSVRGVMVDGLRSEVTYPWDLLDISADLLSEGIVNAPEARPGIYVAKSATVHESATLVEPVVVADDAVVEPGAVVGPEVSIGQNATVGAGAVVRESVVDADTRIGPNSTLVDAVTGENAVLGADVTIPGGPGDVRVGDTIYPDRELGCVVADRATLHGGSTVVPGSLIGPGAVVEHGTTVDGTIPEDSEVIR